MGALVLALNPSVDVEWRVDRVRWEEKNLIASECRWPGGKGINVARWLRCLGGKPELLLPLGGATGAELSQGLKGERIRHHTVRLRGPSRVNVIVTTARDGQLRFNQPGPELSRGEWNEILRATGNRLGRASFLVLSGSLPRGVPADAYARLAVMAERAGVRTILDCDGEALRRAVKARPFLVKPNEHELAGWAGAALRTETSLRRAARALSAATHGWVLVSLGAKGAWLVHEAKRVQLSAGAPRLRTVSTVGAGDALLAAVVRELERETPPAEWLRCGVAAGAAATQCAAGGLPSRRLMREMASRVSVR